MCCQNWQNIIPTNFSHFNVCRIHLRLFFEPNEFYAPEYRWMMSENWDFWEWTRIITISNGSTESRIIGKWAHCGARIEDITNDESKSKHTRNYVYFGLARRSLNHWKIELCVVSVLTLEDEFVFVNRIQTFHLGKCGLMFYLDLNTAIGPNVHNASGCSSRLRIRIRAKCNETVINGHF